MRTISGKLSIATIAVVSTLCLLPFSVVSAISFDEVSAKTIASDGQEQAQSGLPVRLRIPSIKVNSAIEHVGLTSGGAMDVPKKNFNVAWFALGTRPGNEGGAVIAGHYSWRNHGEGGVFHNLYKLHKGDMLYVEDNNGKTISFVVQENRIFKYDADASEVFAPSSGTRLSLITCAGTWDGSKQSSTQRRVIFAEIVRPVVDIGIFTTPA